MEHLPTYLSDNRLLKEVINPEFRFLRDGELTLHTNYHCKSLDTTKSPELTELITRDLNSLGPNELCSNCLKGQPSPIASWNNSPRLIGRALYAISADNSAVLSPDDPRELSLQIIQNIAAHYQVGAATRTAGSTGATWSISIIPDQLANWIDQNFPLRSAAFIVAGPVEIGDTTAMLECAVGLWEQATDGPLTSIRAALEAARSIIQ